MYGLANYGCWCLWLRPRGSSSWRSWATRTRSNRTKTRSWGPTAPLSRIRRKRTLLILLRMRLIRRMRRSVWNKMEPVKSFSLRKWDGRMREWENVIYYYCHFWGPPRPPPRPAPAGDGGEAGAAQPRPAAAQWTARLPARRPSQRRPLFLRPLGTPGKKPAKWMLFRKNKNKTVSHIFYFAASETKEVPRPWAGPGEKFPPGGGFWQENRDGQHKHKLQSHTHRRWKRKRKGGGIRIITFHYFLF